MFQGSFVALVTPFKNGGVDEKKIQELVEWHISEGTNGLVPVGTTGESATLTTEEHLRVIDLVVKATRKRIPVLAGAGSNSTAEAVSLAKEAQNLWADGLLSVCPYYNKPTQEGLKVHFTDIAKAVKIPIILYNIPSRTGVSLKPETVEFLAKKNKNIVGIKDATGSIDQATEIIQRLGPAFSVLSGDDAMTFPLMSVGAQGGISVAANIVPKVMVELCRLASSQKLVEARKIHHKIVPLIKTLFLETNPMPIKTAMAELGLIDSDEVRKPLVPVQPETREKIKLTLKAFGVSVPSPVKL
ncbi:4-hydroxy-tetrahydrodipicolinate synthase [bacterium F11]|nr:4-hydroxy-tetrahydrodipicolinate synthase [bacterium F11]